MRHQRRLRSGEPRQCGRERRAEDCVVGELGGEQETIQQLDLPPQEHLSSCGRRAPARLPLRGPGGQAAQPAHRRGELAALAEQPAAGAGVLGQAEDRDAGGLRRVLPARRPRRGQARDVPALHHRARRLQGRAGEPALQPVQGGPEHAEAAPAAAPRAAEHDRLQHQRGAVRGLPGERPLRQGLRHEGRRHPPAREGCAQPRLVRRAHAADGRADLPAHREGCALQEVQPLRRPAVRDGRPGAMFLFHER
mmetsp:Transcript_26084/g.81344  ORF Transcript_26084/g.81344 Transcript_26084/m.81344 type:complete len:251 (-) Transcript_26084:224-976(-)